VTSSPLRPKGAWGAGGQGACGRGPTGRSSGTDLRCTGRSTILALGCRTGSSQLSVVEVLGMGGVSGS